MTKMGRPKGINNLKYTCTIRLDELMYQRLEKYCERLNAHKSDVIREAVNRIIDEGSDDDE